MKSPMRLLAVMLACLTPTAGVAGGADGTWIGVPPPGGRSAHTLLLDRVQHRVLLFGGTDGAPRNELWALDLDAPAWTLPAPAGAPPPARQDHAAVYDSTRDRWIIFGGTDDSSFNPAPVYFNDVWVLSRDGGYAWTELVPQGSPPPARAGHTAVYDASGDRVLIHGGYDGAVRNDTWALELAGAPGWTQLAPSGDVPDPRRGHVAVFDESRHRMVIFGGDTGLPSGEVWALDVSGSPAWSQLAPSGSPPAGRVHAAAVYDAPRDRMVVFGGFDGNAFRGDAWSLSLEGQGAWSELLPSGAPPGARVAHAAVYDPDGAGMVVFGGSDGTFQHASGVWELSLAGPPAWSEIAAGDAPRGRLAATSIYDPVRERMLLFGGRSGAAMNDVWALSLLGNPAWADLEIPGDLPAPRSDHIAAYDALRDRMVVFGGEYTNETWTLDLAGQPAWTLLSTAGEPPAGRVSHAGILDPVRDRLIVFGGITTTTLLNDVWELPLSTLAWNELQPAGPLPIARRDHVAVYDPVRDRMIVYGGFANTVPFLDDVWALSLSGAPAWTELHPAGPIPEGPLTHAGLYDATRDRFITFGGSYHHEVWALDLDPELRWSELSPSGIPPTGRVDHTVIYDPVGDRMVAFSGHSGLTFLGDTWALAWGASASTGPDAGSPAAREIASFPNPARTTAVFRLDLRSRATVTLRIYDPLGRLVERLAERALAPGTHEITWHLTSRAGARVPSGVYFYRLRAGSFTASGRLHVLR